MRRADLVSALPLHPSTRKYRSLAVLKKKLDMSVVFLQEGGYLTELPQPQQCRVASKIWPPATPPSGLRHSQGTKPLVSGRPGMLVLLTSSVSRKAPLVRLPQLGPNHAAGCHIIPAFFPLFFRRHTLTNNPVRVSNVPCIQTGSVDATRPLSAYKKEVRWITYLLQPSWPTAPPATNEIQWYTTVSTTTL